jgi:hypothetical protein
MPGVYGANGLCLPVDPSTTCVSGNIVGTLDANGNCVLLSASPGDSCIANGCAGIVDASLACVKVDLSCTSLPINHVQQTPLPTTIVNHNNSTYHPAPATTFAPQPTPLTPAQQAAANAAASVHAAANAAATQISQGIGEALFWPVVGVAAAAVALIGGAGYILYAEHREHHR